MFSFILFSVYRSELIQKYSASERNTHFSANRFKQMCFESSIYMVFKRFLLVNGSYSSIYVILNVRLFLLPSLNVNRMLSNRHRNASLEEHMFVASNT